LLENLKVIIDIQIIWSTTIFPGRKTQVKNKSKVEEKAQKVRRHKSRI